MIKRLKNKFLITIMVFVTIIITAFVGFITFVPARENREEAKQFLTMIANNNGVRSFMMSEKPEDIPSNGILPDNGTMPPPMERPRNTMYMATLATAHFDAGGNLEHWFSDRQDLYDEEYLLSISEKLLDSDDEFGVTDDNYYLVKHHEKGWFVILLDNSIAFNAQRNTAIMACCAGVAAWIALLFMAMFLVDKMTRPVSDAFTKQRQFISDAGHELKTPISVISANANVLQTETGDNKWLDYIISETHRMEYLVKNLMTLAAIDDDQKEISHAEFDLSNAVWSVSLPFESLAFEKGMVMDFNIAENVTCTGSEELIKQLVSILLSNAVKYGNENGSIRVTLAKERRKNVISVYNTGIGISAEDINMVFERFYRGDKSRSRDGQSYGLGLAIAKSITEEHHGEIKAESEYGKWVNFIVELPVR